VPVSVMFRQNLSSTIALSLIQILNLVLHIPLLWKSTGHLLCVTGKLLECVFSKSCTVHEMLKDGIRNQAPNFIQIKLN